jgi:hypothetical protein
LARPLGRGTAKRKADIGLFLFPVSCFLFPVSIADPAGEGSAECASAACPIDPAECR